MDLIEIDFGLTKAYSYFKASPFLLQTNYITVTYVLMKGTQSKQYKVQYTWEMYSAFGHCVSQKHSQQ